MTDNFYDIEFFDQYVIITIHQDINLCINRASVIREKIQNHFVNAPFVMISYRKYEHKVMPEVYKKGQLKNMKGLAIVSSNKTDRIKALTDQKLFSKSFAFFRDIEAAKSWAETLFI